MKKTFIALTVLMTLLFTSNANAQIKIEDLQNEIGNLLGQKQLLSVKKGFSPVFKIGNVQVNKVGILGEKLKGVAILGDIFNSKGVADIKKLYKTYKTGLVIFNVLAASGTAVAAYSTIRGISSDTKFNSSTVKAMLYPALTSIATSVITKVLTKKASYKAVDIFNGVVRNKIKDILSVKPATQNIGVGLFVKL